MSNTLMVMKKIFGIALAVLVILIGIFFLQLTPRQPITTQTQQKPTAQQTQQPEYQLPSIVYENDTAKADSYQISLVRPKGFPAAIQQRIDAFYDEAKNITLTGAQAVTQTSITQQPVVHMLASQKPLITNAGPFVFILASTVTSTDGTHGEVKYFQLAYSAITGQEVTLDQLFADPTTAYQSVAQAVAPYALNKVASQALGSRDPKTLTEDEKKVIMDTVYKGLTPTQTNYQNWYMTSTGNLVIVFPPNQIAPSSFGEEVITVPLSTLKDSLNSEIFKIQ